MTRQLTSLAAALLLGAAAPAGAQTDSDRLRELERKINVLTGEMDRLKLGEAADEPALASVQGFGPAASKVYQKAPKRVSIGGYGEMTYQNRLGRSDEWDFLRAVLYVGYKFNDWILFNSELEFEHGTTGSGRGSISVEMAYLDFMFHKAFNARAGLLLMPMGLINEVHEPTTFHGVRRPNVEQNIIPTTWRENGAGVFGEVGPLSYRSYLVAGLQADNGGSGSVSGFSGSSGLRGGRSNGGSSIADDKAWVSRVDVKPVQGVTAGGSFYVGQADQNLPTLAGDDVSVTLWETHASAEYKGAELRALYAEGHISNATRLNSVGNGIGSKIFGGYVEGAFDVLSLCSGAKGHYLAPFVRYERYDTQLRTPDSFAKSPANSRVEYTAGLTYKPIPQVVVKWDFQWLNNQGVSSNSKQWNAGIGYIF